MNRRLVLAGLCGMAFVRLWLDFFSPDWLLIVAFLAGSAVGWFWPYPRWTLYGLFVYLASPFPLPHLAVIAVSLMVVGVLHAQVRLIPAFGVGVAVFVLFVVTLSPGLLPADAGEFQLVAAEWGVAHPPGYPLYTFLAGSTAHLVPFGTPAWRVNLFSALTGALTVGIAAYTVQRETGKFWVGWLAGLTLAVSTTFWMTSTQASIRPMTALFTVLMLEAVLAYHHGHASRALIRFGVAAGLGVTHHGSLFFVGLALGVFTFKDWKKWPLMVGAALVGMLPWLYLLVRADGLLAPADLKTWDGFWNHVLARGFASDMFAYAAPEYWPERWQVMIQVYRLQWHLWILLLALVGLGWVLWQHRRMGFILLLAFITHTLVVGMYRAPQTVEYALPAYVILAVAAGCFVGKVQNRPLQIVFATLLLSGVIFSFQSGWVTMRRLAAQEEARDSALATFEQAPPDALILASWHRATPLWYLQQVENKRPDVTVRYVNPEGNLTPMQRWVHLIEENLFQRPVLVTQIFTEAYRALPYTIENERILPTPHPLEATEHMVDLGLLSLVEIPPIQREIAAGETLRITLDWLAAIQPEEISTFIHVGAADQPPLAQADLFLQMNAAGKIRQFYDVLIPIIAPPGEWQVWAGTYTSDQQERILLGTVTIHPAEFPAPTQHSIFREMGAARLYGWDYDMSAAGEANLYLHWTLHEKSHHYKIKVMDVEGGLWSESQAFTDEQTGYWTSIHSLPASIAQGGVTVSMDGHTIKIPAADDRDRYILFGNTAALVDWQIKFEPDKTEVEVTLLPFGATFEDIQIQIAAPETFDFTPVSGSMPSFKWAYNRELVSQQKIDVIHPQEITFLLYDGLTGRVVPAGRISLYKATP